MKDLNQSTEFQRERAAKGKNPFGHRSKRGNRKRALRQGADRAVAAGETIFDGHLDDAALFETDRTPIRPKTKAARDAWRAKNKKRREEQQRQALAENTVRLHLPSIPSEGKGSRTWLAGGEKERARAERRRAS